MGPVKRHGPAEWLIIACGLWQIGLGIYFIFMRSALLPEDIRYMNLDTQVLETTIPRLAAWLGKVFAVMGGFMAGAGVLIAYFGWQVMPRRLPGSLAALALAGAPTLLLQARDGELSAQERVGD